MKFKGNFLAACLQVWKDFFENLVWMNSSFGFSNFEIYGRVEIQKLKQRVKR